MDETIKHVLFECDFSKGLWSSVISDEQLQEEVFRENGLRWGTFLDMLQTKGLVDQGMYLC